MKKAVSIPVSEDHLVDNSSNTSDEIPIRLVGFTKKNTPHKTSSEISNAEQKSLKVSEAGVNVPSLNAGKSNHDSINSILQLCN